MSFINLPREIRDTIYGHIFTAPSYTTVFNPIRRPSDRKPERLDILCVSKQVSTEAQHILYSHRAFRLCIDSPNVDIPEGFFHEHASRLMQEVAINICVDRYCDLDPTARQAMEQQHQTIITRLTRLEHPLRTCRISLSYGKDYSVPQFHAKRWSEPLKVLVGFEAVVVQVLWPSRIRSPRGSRALYFDPYEQAKTDVRDVLEPELGPAVVDTKSRGPGEWGPRTFWLSFKPRRELARMALEKEGKLSKQQRKRALND